MAAAAHAEVQSLLRFLTQDAKVPLGDALPKIGILRKRKLNSADAIAKAGQTELKDIFTEDKILKQVTLAAKRVTNPKKRSADVSAPAAAKRMKGGGRDEQDLEAQLSLPVIDCSVEDLQAVKIETNRAPLVLAFAVASLRFTKPDQPLSSRLSLAQAVVSANSQTRAKTIGLTTGATAEDEGWASGQPKLKVMSREIAVMRRQTGVVTSDGDSQETVQNESVSVHEAFWGIDLEALRRSNGHAVMGKTAPSQGPPIYQPDSARSYLLKSFSPIATDLNDVSKKRVSSAEIVARREKAAAMLLKAIELVCESWADTLSHEELDRRAWSWYVSVRPDIAQGQAGWGQRGVVDLSHILKLRKDA